MRRAAKWLAWIVGVLVGVPVLLVAGVLALANVAPGQRLIEQLTTRFTGGMVVLQGLSGRVPDALRVAHLELRDARGAWLTVDHVALDWSPTRLLGKQASIQSLTADSLDLPRLPETQPSAAPASDRGSSFQLPVTVSLERLHVGRLAIGAPVAGAAAVAEVDGHATLAALYEGDVDVTLRRLDSPGDYHLVGRLDPASIQATLTAGEPAHGFVSTLAGLPDLGVIAVQAKLDGPRSAAATTLDVSAGELRASAQGTLDLVGMGADLDVTASAPAMTPRPDVAWQAVALRAHVHGPFATPDATGTLTIDGLQAAGARLAKLSSDVQGNAGEVKLRATLADLTIPGPKPQLLAGAPVELQADVRLDQPARPVTFTLAHPLIQATGHADTAPDIAASVDLTLPDLAPLAAAGGVDLQGRTTLAVQAAMKDGRTSVAVTGTLGITGGMAPIPALIGADAKLDLAASLQGSDILLDHLKLDGSTLSVAASGSDRANVLDVTWQVALADLKQVAATLDGAVQAHGHVAGPLSDLAVQAEAAGEVGAPGVPRGPLQLAVDATGLPSHPAGTITAQGTLAGAPLSLAAQVARDADGTMHATIRQADWKSAHAEGAFTLPAAATLPVGKLDLRMASLEDLRPFIGQPLRGSLSASADLTDDAAKLGVELRQVALGANGMARASLTATVDHPLADPVVSAKLSVDGIAAAGITGRATLDAAGPQTALGLRLAADLANLAGADAHATAAALLDVPAKRVSLSALQMDWQGEALRLLAPVRVAFGDGVTLDRLRLGLGAATLELAGKVMPALDLTVALRGVTPELAKPFVPGLDADGLIQADARLTGAPAHPSGTVRVTASGLHMRSGPGRSLPPATLNAGADLAGTRAQINLALAAGTLTRLNVTGQAPLDASGTLALRSTGAVDLALLDPILAIQGRRVRGRVSLDATIGGTVPAPRVSGSILLADGDVQDFAQGAHVSGIGAAVDLAGDTLRINRFSGKAGGGTIGLTGTIGILAPDRPVDLVLTMRRAQPLATDRLTATLNADLTLRGALATRMQAAGKITIVTASIRVPENLPSSVAVLNVRRSGQPPPPPASPGPEIGLDVTVDAPGAVFVRGRGLDAELGGTLHVGGTAAAPVPSGGFQMRRGTFSVAGTTLTFTKGDIGFNGAGATDPTIHFVADNTTSNVVATLTVTGYASAPKIVLSSVPDLPQDEVLSYLLFRRSAAQLSPFQLVAIAQTLASFSGVGGGVADPLESIRSGLGLDRLAVGGGATGSTPTVEAGRYVANGVYVGAKQGTSGAETQAEVQIDITRGLKLETDVGSGKGGNSVGLTYQFEY